MLEKLAGLLVLSLILSLFIFSLILMVLALLKMIGILTFDFNRKNNFTSRLGFYIKNLFFKAAIDAVSMYKLFFFSFFISLVIVLIIWIR